MSCCGDRRTKSRCGTLTPAVCVKYEGDYPEWSDLKEESCVNVEEVLEELYDKTDGIQEDITLGNLDSCITYDREVDGSVKINTAVKKHSEILCEILGAGDPSETDLSPDISRWGLDFKCLVDECANPPATLKQLLQLLINQVCGGDTPINTNPIWTDTGNKGCSSSSSTYVPSQSGQFSFKEQRDTNQNSNSYNDTKWVRNTVGDADCAPDPEPDTTPNWQKTGISGCSSNSGSYIPLNPTPGQSYTGFAFDEQRDTNTHSITYNTKRWVRNSSNDSDCIYIAPPWTDTGIKDCSSSSTSYVPNVNGQYGFKEQSNGTTTRWVRDTTFDNVCNVDTSALWEKQSGTGGCSFSKTSMVTSGTGERFWIDRWKDVNPHSSTYGNTEYREDTSKKNQCPYYDPTPDWTKTGNDSGCSFSRTAMVTEGTGERYWVDLWRDANPNSPTYDEKEYREDTSKKGQCPYHDPEAAWTKTNEDSGCSFSRNAMVQSGVGERYWVDLWRDTNPNSPTFDETEYREDTSKKGQCPAYNPEPEWIKTAEDSGCSYSKTTMLTTGTGERYWIDLWRDDNPESPTYQTTKYIEDTSRADECPTTHGSRWAVDPDDYECEQTDSEASHKWVADTDDYLCEQTNAEPFKWVVDTSELLCEQEEE